LNVGRWMVNIGCSRCENGPVAQRLEQPRTLSGLVIGDVLCFTV
jgi:hypothetical protein